jgi:CheY-like chemotaxis protein/HPt (histidine-containing phosphotransfer) domain-containing protein
LINLLGNAIKFSSGLDRIGRVSVRVEVVEQDSSRVTLNLTVSDNGVGIDRKTHAGLFQPFSQADGSTTRRFGGTGLGLAITKMLVDLQGGQLAVESKLGEGATFSVLLPFEVISSSDSGGIGERSLSDLQCKIIGAEAQLATDLARYLIHAGAKVECLLAGADIVHEGQEPDTSIWLILPRTSETEQRALYTLAAQWGDPARVISLYFGGKTEFEIEPVFAVSVDLNTLTRASLVQRVATAAGRFAPVELGGKSPCASGTAEPLAIASKHIQRVLVAEDNETNREVIERQLKLLGLDAEMTVNGRQALERWRSGSFHLVLTDVRMPVMDGYALAKAIRSEEKGGHRTIIIALTANALPEEEGLCLAAGMDAYLIKPITSSRLKAAVLKWLPERDGATEIGTADADTAASPISLEVIKSLIGDDPTGVVAVLQKFRGNSSQLSSELEIAIKSDLCMAVVDIAHKLKSGALSIGADRLGQICVDIEHAANGGKHDQLHALLPTFLTLMRDVHSSIDAVMR